MAPPTNGGPPGTGRMRQVFRACCRTRKSPARNGRNARKLYPAPRVSRRAASGKREKCCAISRNEIARISISSSFISSICLEIIPQYLLAASGQERFGMKLDGLDAKAAVAKGHD